MKLVEADGKRLLREAGIATPAGFFLSFDAVSMPPGIAWPGPVFVKSQVLQGRRGASGLLLRCETEQELPSVLTLLRERIGEKPCAGFLCETPVLIQKEWFLAFDAKEGFRVSLSEHGGMDVKEAKTYSIADIDAQQMSPSFKKMLHAFFDVFKHSDATHLEINPLAETPDGEFIALDAKIELDDAAAFRHPEWSTFHQLSAFGRAPTEREGRYEEFLLRAGHRGTFGRYLELSGDIALILSGGGASLLALDAMQRAGGRAANYLEVSGNPDPEKLCEAVKIALSKPGLTGVWVAGSFANFTDIQATCAAVLRAMKELGVRIPIVIRRDGPNADQAEQESLAWSQAEGIPLLFHRADTSLEASARELLAQLV